MKCPMCGEEGNFDGWGSSNACGQVREALPPEARQAIYDDWSAMKLVADTHGVEWCPSPDNRWFPRIEKG